MNQDDFLILLLALALLLAMILTFVIGGERSRHGVSDQRHRIYPLSAQPAYCPDHLGHGYESG